MNSLIDLFEYCLNQNFNSSCIQIYSILVHYLELYYQNKPFLTLSPTNATHIITTPQQQHKLLNQLESINNTSSVQQLHKTYSQTVIENQQQPQQQDIRKNVFDFLMRLRSDERHQLFLLCKNDRKKLKLSKYLILSMRFENLKNLL